MSASTAQVPIVDYLVLGEDPHLRAHECVSCGARFFDRRNACAACGRTRFREVRVATVGELRTFTIVHLAAPGVPVPFVAGVIDCKGTTVRANIVNVDPEPTEVRMGMRVKLTTFSLGADDAGVEAFAFGFEPCGRERDG